MQAKNRVHFCIFLISFFVGQATAESEGLCCCDWGIQPYLGVNFKYSWVKPVDEWRRLFTTAHPGFAVYLGGRFHPNFGLEVGYEWTDNKWTNNEVLNSGSLLGVTNIQGNSILASRLRLTTAHIDLNAFFPVSLACGIQPEGIVSIGVGSVKPWIDIKSLTPKTAFTNQLSAMTGKSKTIARFGLGIQTQLIECVGVRLLWRYETTGKLEVKNSEIVQTEKNHKIFGNSQALLAGLFVNF